MLLSGCEDHKAKVIYSSKPAYTILTTKLDYENNGYSSQRNKLVSFIQRKMMTNQGIITQVKNKQTSQNSYLLSESAGLWLEYLALTGKKRQFANFYILTKKTFDQNGKQFSYRYSEDNNYEYNTNATLDDLRIIQSLIQYDAINHTNKYQKEAAVRFSYLKLNCMYLGQLRAFYDIKQKKASNNGPLAYFDFLVLRYFENNTVSGKKEYRKQLRVVENGYLGDVFPLYASEVNWKTGRYSTKKLNTSEALETLLHLAEIKHLKRASLDWLIQQVRHQSLANSYSVSGNVIDDNQSPANYALAALIFANNGNIRNYRQAMRIVWGNQLNEHSTNLFGSITQSQDLSYSFNNLVSLIASLG